MLAGWQQRTRGEDIEMKCTRKLRQMDGERERDGASIEEVLTAL
jgi:hypothetical protein